MTLADRWHRPLNELEAVMTPAELVLWQVYFDMKEQDRQQEPG